MRIRLSDHFTYGKLMRYTIPSIAMMIFTSVYGVVDGFFVSNFAGKTPFSAVNLIMPFLMIVATVGFMFGTGGTAIVVKTLGEGDMEKANKYFSLFVYAAVTLSVIFAISGIVFIRPISALLGAKGIAAYGVMMYVSMIFSAAFIGYSIGVAQSASRSSMLKPKYFNRLSACSIVIGAFDN